MPNGGYPMHLLTPIAGTNLGLHAVSTELELVGYPAVDAGSADRHRPVPVASLSREQVGALTHHLLYWNGPLSAEVRASLSGARLPIRPQFHTRGCRYDY